MPLKPGDRLGRYEVLSYIGQGATGTVYRGRGSTVAGDVPLVREVALKILSDDFSDSPDHQARLKREAQVLAGLSHPGLVTVFGIEQIDRRWVLVMEFVEGPTLTEVIRQGPQPVDRILSLAIQIADAVGAAHRHGIIHRDLKPGNVKVTDGDRIKVLDFGLAKTVRPQVLTDDSTTSFPEGRIVGTVPYMSPEQTRGESLDSSSDLFSLGVLLFELATGERPFKGESPQDTIAAINRGNHLRVTDLRPDLPVRLSDLIDHCLLTHARFRRQSATDLHWELTNLQKTPANPPGRGSDWKTLAGVTATVAVVLGAWSVLPWSGRESARQLQYAADFDDQVVWGRYVEGDEPGTLRDDGVELECVETAAREDCRLTYRRVGFDEADGYVAVTPETVGELDEALIEARVVAAPGACPRACSTARLFVWAAGVIKEGDYEPLRPGSTVSLSLDLRRTDWQGPYQGMGVHFYFEGEFPGPVYLDDVRVYRAP